MVSDTDKITAKTQKSTAADTPRQKRGDDGAKALKSEDAAVNKADGRGKTRAETNEVGGRGGLDPTRYGDWEINGRCVDF